MPKNATTEDTVNSVIDRFIDTGADDTGTDNDDGENETSGADATGDDDGQGDATGTDKKAALEGDDTKDATRTGDSKGNKGDGTGKQPVAGKGTADAKGRPGPKDLVDPNTGQVLARAGHERRVWESSAAYTRNQYQQFINSRLQPQIEQMKGKIEAYERVSQTAQQFQLTPDDQMTGFKLVAALRKDPVATIDFLIEQAKANGHNISIGDKIAGIDANAVSRMVDGKLQPILAEHANREQVATAYRTAENELGQFYSRYPNARVNEQTIDNLLQKFPELNLETAYLRLQNFMLSNGFNPNESLVAQLEARKKAGSNGRANQDRRVPNPGGRGNPSVAEIGSDKAPVKYAHEDTSYRDIVREAMQEHGALVN